MPRPRRSRCTSAEDASSCARSPSTSRISGRGTPTPPGDLRDRRCGLCRLTERHTPADGTALASMCDPCQASSRSWGHSQSAAIQKRRDSKAKRFKSEALEASGEQRTWTSLGEGASRAASRGSMRSLLGTPGAPSEGLSLPRALRALCMFSLCSSAATTWPLETSRVLLHPPVCK